jgi:hypothetical protein
MRADMVGLYAVMSTILARAQVVLEVIPERSCHQKFQFSLFCSRIGNHCQSHPRSPLSSGQVGVVGRTGSGKTTLLMALFRMFELSYGRYGAGQCQFLAYVWCRTKRGVFNSLFCQRFLAYVWCRTKRGVLRTHPKSTESNNT